MIEEVGQTRRVTPTHERWYCGAHSSRCDIRRFTISLGKCARPRQATRSNAQDSREHPGGIACGCELDSWSCPPNLDASHGNTRQLCAWGCNGTQPPFKDLPHQGVANGAKQLQGALLGTKQQRMPFPRPLGLARHERRPYLLTNSPRHKTTWA